MSAATVIIEDDVQGTTIVELPESVFVDDDDVTVELEEGDVEVDVIAEVTEVTINDDEFVVQTTETEIETVDIGIQGPPGGQGGPGPQGPPGSSTATYVHNQPSASTVWVIVHNLGYRPNVTIFDSGDTIVEGEEVHNSVNQLTLTFSVAIGGTAILS